MRQARFYAAGAGLLLVVAGAAEMARHEAARPTEIGVADPFKVALRPAPINKAWILDGDNQTSSARIARTDDLSTDLIVWQTGKGRFRWFYDFDETITVVDGEVFITDDKTHVERRLGPGDAAFFPRGGETTWRVPDHVRKVATVKHKLPAPVASAIRWMHEIKDWLRPTPALAAE